MTPQAPIPLIDKGRPLLLKADGLFLCPAKPCRMFCLSLIHGTPHICCSSSPHRTSFRHPFRPLRARLSLFSLNSIPLGIHGKTRSERLRGSLSPAVVMPGTRSSLRPSSACLHRYGRISLSGLAPRKRLKGTGKGRSSPQMRVRASKRHNAKHRHGLEGKTHGASGQRAET